MELGYGELSRRGGRALLSKNTRRRAAASFRARRRSFQKLDFSMRYFAVARYQRRTPATFSMASFRIYSHHEAGHIFDKHLSLRVGHAASLQGRPGGSRARFPFHFVVLADMSI